MKRVDPGKQVFVYGLHAKSSETIMYVGCSVNPTKRRKEHVSEAMLASRRGYHLRPLHAWIVSCLKGGDTISSLVLEKGVASDAPLIETKWIDRVRAENPSILNEKRAPAYCSHLRTIAEWLQPVKDAAPGDTVFQVKKSYLIGKDTDEIVPAKVIKITEYNRILIGGLVGNAYKERWVSRFGLYRPKDSTAYTSLANT